MRQLTTSSDRYFDDAAIEGDDAFDPSFDAFVDGHAPEMSWEALGIVIDVDGTPRRPWVDMRIDPATGAVLDARITFRR